MYGCEVRIRWAIAMYRNAIVVLSLMYFLITIELIVILAESSYKGLIIFIVILSMIIFILMGIWLLVCYFYCRKYIAQLDWFREKNNEKIIRSQGGLQSGDEENNLKQDLMK